MEKHATGTEDEAQHGNIKDLYNTTNKLSNKFGQSERPVKDKQDRVI